MTDFVYINDIPNASNNPSTDQPNMKANNNNIPLLIGVDHVSFNSNNNFGGYHTIIHQVDQASAPPFIPGINQLFSMIPPSGIPDTIHDQLFSLNNGGGLSQLTGGNASNNGYQWLGNILIQWGQLTSTASTYQTLTFATSNKTFPNNCFTVFTQPYGSGTPAGSQATVQIRKSTISKTSFDWVFVTNSAQYTGFFWVAIGN